ncbi:alanine--tRNA ligase [uncultured Arthrobacter sp.]|uniref:alanine--tRNA ligase n=1 Tax=uncultured Arthrobacter sp. TaxID=114050 RepID=UPI003216541E
MKSQEITKRWIDFFVSKGHTAVPSASLVSSDPSLLFTVAGMVPFIPYLTAREEAPYKRATSVQKCIRTGDIEEVGKTARHGTFFQMCGNFSFGDYFKEDAIKFAWELLTTSVDDGGYGLPPELLWVTVYEEDDEAEQLWLKNTGMPAERIQRMGKADNYWSTGQPGPAGPCSEIYYDRGPSYGVEGGPIADENRYVEIWNLVFMQYQIDNVRSKVDFDITGELPKKNIDTGLGMERLAMILQDVENMYETDQVRPVIDKAAALSGREYTSAESAEDPHHTDDVRMRVVADHIRSSLMLIADGVTPSNEGRGYVLRRILRRTVRSMRLLGAGDPVMASLMEASISAMGPQYPELVDAAGRITTIAVAEEGSFLETLTKGATVFDSAVPAARAAGGVLSGDAAFSLHDTYGFPIDLTLEMAAEQGLSVDEEGFRSLMAEQRSRAKADAKAKKTGGADLGAYRSLLETAGATEFTGYGEISSEAVLRGLLVDGAVAPSAAEGSVVEVVLDRSPFYAEAGGQKADAGRIVLSDGTVLLVGDVQHALPGLTVHKARVVSGEARVGTSVLAEVDVERRRSISRAHTATHLVHTAFRAALGEQATQAGSENNPGRFRFDFASPSAVPASVLADVEQEINEIALADLEVRAFVTSQDEARRLGAMALFGEKYGDQVRVVEVGDYARELCGGTHAARSGQLGMVKLLSEASIGSGVRRVEGLVGLDAYSYLAREHLLLAQLASTFKVPSAEVPDRVAGVVARLREVEKELATLRASAVLTQASAFAAGARDVFGVAFVGVEAPAGTPGDLVRQLALDVRGRLAADRPGVVLVAAGGERVTLVAAVNDAGRARGLSANDVLREAAAAVDGKGGGKDDVAQGGGSNAAGIPDALLRAEHLIGRVATGGG